MNGADERFRSLERAVEQELDARAVADLFVTAFEELLALDRSLLRAVLDESDDTREFLEPFLRPFDTAASSAVAMVREGLVTEDPAVLEELVTALKLSGLPAELVALEHYCHAPSSSISAGEKLQTADDVTDSIKELIKKFKNRPWWRWWLEPILDAIDEVLRALQPKKPTPKPK